MNIEKGDIIKHRDTGMKMLVIEANRSKKVWHRYVVVVPIICPSLTLSGVVPIRLPYQQLAELNGENIYEIVSKVNKT